jgi:hypothetical protein
MRFLVRIIPSKFKRIAKVCALLTEQYGYRRSIAEEKSIDHEGKSIPWYTYPCIEYLQSLDLSKCSVLEYGSGASSFWWAERAFSVLAVEHDSCWFNKIANEPAANLQITLAENEDKYIGAASKSGKKFDIIIIDGLFRHRCAEEIGNIVSDEFIIILDNSDWHPKTAALLRTRCNLLQVDFHGFGPINNYTWTTSIFFSRNFSIVPAELRLPTYSVGAIRQLADDQ